MVMMPQLAWTWEDNGPEGLTISVPFYGLNISSKDVVVEIKPKSIIAGIKDSCPVLQGALYSAVSPDDCMWTIDRKVSVISIHLEKESPDLWPFVIGGPDESGACDAHSIYSLAFISEGGMAREPMPGQEGNQTIIPPNEEQSLVYYKQAAGAGHAGAMMRLAELYAPPIRQKSKASAQNVRVKPLVGQGAAAKSGAFATLEKDADTALHYYKLAAEKGAVSAMCQYGLALYDPSSLSGSWETDVAAAKEWCQRAADAGSPDGCWAMGVMAENGSAQDAPNFSEAAKWYKKAGNLPQALHRLGWMAIKGQGGLSKDRISAMQLFESASKQDCRLAVPTDAQIAEELGSGSVLGLGVEPRALVGVLVAALVAGCAYYVAVSRRAK